MRFLSSGVAWTAAFLAAAPLMAGHQTRTAAPLKQLPGTIVALPEPSALFPWIYGLPTAAIGDSLPGTKVAVPEPPSRIWWTVPLAAGPAGAPLVHGDYVLVPRLPGNIVAHHLEDGGEAWHVELALEQPLAADGGLIFAVADDAVHALRATDGSAAWRTTLGRLTAPLVAKDGWIIASTASRLVALRATNGTEVWTQSSGLQRARGTIFGNVLFLPLADGHVEARDLQTGEIRWRRPLGGAPGEPLVARDELFVGASDRRFYCLDAGSGDIEWPARVGATVLGRPSTDGTRVFFAAFDNLVYARDLGHGALRWHQPMPFRPLAAPVASGEFVVVAGPAAEVRILRAVDGRDAGRIAFAQKLALAPAIAERGNAILIAAVTGDLAESWNLSVAAWPRHALPPIAKPLR